MDLFGQDMVIGDFKLSDYGLMLGAFDFSGTSEDELGMDSDTIEEFVGSNSVPLYITSKFSNKLKPQATIIKKNCMYTDQFFTEHECREILRQLTGFQGYKTMQVQSENFSELLYFNARIQSVNYKKIGGNVAGVILNMECDSQFAWSKEFTYTYNIKAGNTIVLYNFSDDLYNYLYPTITIIPKSPITSLNIINITDNEWTTTLSNLSAGEIITMDSKNEILTSSNKERIIMNDFNMHFFRLISGKNIISVNSDVTLNISFRVPRKVGFL